MSICFFVAVTPVVVGLSYPRYPRRSPLTKSSTPHTTSNTHRAEAGHLLKTINGYLSVRVTCE